MFALSKMECVFLNGKRVPPTFTFTLGDTQVRPLSVVRYLGVLFDVRRTFRPHIEMVTAKALRMAGALSRLLVNQREPALFVSRAYYAVLESVFLYAAPPCIDVTMGEIRM